MNIIRWSILTLFVLAVLFWLGAVVRCVRSKNVDQQLDRMGLVIIGAVIVAGLDVAFQIAIHV